MNGQNQMSTMTSFLMTPNFPLSKFFCLREETHRFCGISVAFCAFHSVSFQFHRNFYTGPIGNQFLDFFNGLWLLGRGYVPILVKNIKKYGKFFSKVLSTFKLIVVRFGNFVSRLTVCLLSVKTRKFGKFWVINSRKSGFWITLNCPSRHSIC